MGAIDVLEQIAASAEEPKQGKEMSFFDSEIVRAEMVEIHELQEDVYENFMKFPYMNNADRNHHIDQLSKLIEKQKIVYARLSLSDDPDAKEMKENHAIC